MISGSSPHRPFGPRAKTSGNCFFAVVSFSSVNFVLVFSVIGLLSPPVSRCSLSLPKPYNNALHATRNESAFNSPPTSHLARNTLHAT
jgi:hypothetical protein